MVGNSLPPPARTIGENAFPIFPTGRDLASSLAVSIGTLGAVIGACKEVPLLLSTGSVAPELMIDITKATG